MQLGRDAPENSDLIVGAVLLHDVGHDVAQAQGQGSGAVEAQAQGQGVQAQEENVVNVVAVGDQALEAHGAMQTRGQG